jgi:hypothetical protein
METVGKRAVDIVRLAQGVVFNGLLVTNSGDSTTVSSEYPSGEDVARGVSRRSTGA